MALQVTWQVVNFGFRLGFVHALPFGSGKPSGRDSGRPADSSPTVRAEVEVNEKGKRTCREGVREEDGVEVEPTTVETSAVTVRFGDVVGELFAAKLEKERRSYTPLLEVSGGRLLLLYRLM